MLYPFAAFLFVLLTMPLFIRVAHRFGMHDRPDLERKLHHGNVPYTGGLAFILGWGLVTGSMFLLDGETLSHWHIATLNPMMMYISEAAVVIFFLGMIDDLRDLSFQRKFLFQFLASFLIILGAIKSNVFPKVFNAVESGVLLNSIGTIISVFWLVGVTNAVNFIDGMDGLAAGSSVISAGAMGALAFAWGNPPLGLMFLVLAGALLGFIAYNTHPARVFMGDTGSMFLGFILGVLGWLLVDHGPAQPTVFFVPVIILGLPISDTLLAFSRRIMTRQNPFAADRFHVHHMLKRRFGLSTRGTVLVLYGVSLLYAGFGVAVALLPELYGWLTIGVLAAGQAWFFHMLGYTEHVLRAQPEPPLYVLGANGLNGTNGVHTNGHNGNGHNGHAAHANGNGSAKPQARPQPIDTADEDSV